MNIRHLFRLLIAITYITSKCAASINNNNNNNGDGHPFADRIKTLQDETGHACSYIEGMSFDTTVEFISLIQDAHIHCPNFNKMEVSLTNIATQAVTYNSYITKQLSDCKALFYMLTKSLDNGGLVDYYLNEGNYSLVTSTIDKWHQSFSDLRSSFHLTDTPLDIILNNKKIFFYDSWIRNLAKSILTLIALFIGSFIIVKFLKWMNLISWILAVFSSPAASPHERQLPTESDSPQLNVLETNSDHHNLYQRRPNWVPYVPPKEVNTEELTSNSFTFDNKNAMKYPSISVPHKLYVAVMIGVWFAVFCVLTAFIVFLDPSQILVHKSSSYCWYPDAIKALEKMKVGRDKVQATVSHQILSIEKLQRYVNMYHDTTIQTNADELVHNLGKGIRQITREVPELYIASEKMPTTFRKAYTNIEAMAKKAGRLKEANQLLVVLNETSEIYEKLQRSIETLVINQNKLLPILKGQTKTIQALVQQGHVMDINRITKEHINILTDLDGIACNIHVEVKQLIQITEGDRSDERKGALEELKDQTAADQYRAMLYGTAGVGGGFLGTVVMGFIAIKSGYAVVSITATALTAPVAAVAGLGLFGFAIHSIATNFDKYKDASRYATELDILEIQRRNLNTAMKNFEKALIEQQTASKATLRALNYIVTHSASFSDVPGFTLSTEKRTALSEELLDIIQQYNIMMSIFNSYKLDAARRDKKHLLK